MAWGKQRTSATNRGLIAFALERQGSQAKGSSRVKDRKGGVVAYLVGELVREETIDKLQEGVKKAAVLARAVCVAPKSRKSRGNRLCVSPVPLSLEALPFNVIGKMAGVKINEPFNRVPEGQLACWPQGPFPVELCVDGHNIRSAPTGNSKACLTRPRQTGP